MANKVNLIYEIEGDTENGIDVFELAPILLSMGKLIRDSRNLADPDGPEIAVNIKPFEKNSFWVEIVLYAKTNLQQLINYANKDDIKQIKELVEWLGIIASSSIGVIKLIKWLGGNPPRSTGKTSKGDYKYISTDGDSVTVPEKTHLLFQDNNIKELIYKTYIKPLEKEGITEIKTFLKGEKNNAVSILKAEAPFFVNLSNLTIDHADEQQIENNVELILNPKRGSYEGEPNSWSFRAGDSTISVHAIRDATFLQKIKSGEIRLFSGDTIRAKLLQKQKICKGQAVSLNYEITEVIQYAPGIKPEQYKLPEPPESSLK